MPSAQNILNVRRVHFGETCPEPFQVEISGTESPPKAFQEKIFAFCPSPHSPET